MLGQFGGARGRYESLAGMDSPNRVQEFSMHVPLQYVTPRTRFKSAQHLDVACIRRQDDDSGIGEFASNADDGLDSVQGGHLEIHHRYIRPMQPELFDRYLSITGLRDQLHVGFS